MSPTPISSEFRRPVATRRQVLGGIAAGAAGLLAGCSTPRAETTFVSPDGPQVRAAEAARTHGTVRDVRLTASADQVDIGGRTVATWTYGGRLPGSPIRLKAGEVLRATLDNRLPAPTSIHWHGLALRNDADGVPDVTQPAVTAGGSKTYEFTTDRPGTYWFHPHQGVQLDRGLYAPLIIDDPREPLTYDDEWVIVLDDWLDGVDGTPDDVLAELKAGMGGMTMSSGMTMGGHTLMGATSSLLGGDAGDVKYPYFLINGRRAQAPAGYRGKPGTRLRLRIINAGADTAFRVALGGHRLTVTHTDGYPVRPITTDALLIGMGERYDALVTLADGVFPLVAAAEGKNATAMAVIRTGPGGAPTPATRPKELNGRIIGYADLHPADTVRLPGTTPDRTIRLELTGGMDRYNWAINGKPYDPGTITPVHAGELVRIDYVNTTTMWHPMHLHGHTFAVNPTGARKDTAIVLPKRTLTTVFVADNPGLWMIHCHNVYHAESGMMTLLGYLA